MICEALVAAAWFLVIDLTDKPHGIPMADREACEEAQKVYQAARPHTESICLKTGYGES